MNTETGGTVPKSDARLERAKQYIAKGDEYYLKAGEEIDALRGEGWSWPRLSQELGRSEHWLRVVVEAATNPTARGRNWESGSNKRTEVGTSVLRNPEQRRQVLAGLSSRELDEVAADVTEVAVERVTAQRRERTSHSEPTTGDLMGGDRFDPSESWADTLIVRVANNMRLLGAHVQKNGLVFGTMREDEAYEYMLDIERRAADLRAAIQERISDGVIA